MITTTAPIQNFTEGQHYPSPVAKIIGLGYYDGVTNGILRTGDGFVYTFEMIGEIQGSDDGEDIRQFELKPLPTDAFELIVSAIAPYHVPMWPSWTPIWKFPDEATMAAVDSLIDKQLKRAGQTAWVVESANLLSVIISAQRRGSTLLAIAFPNNGTGEASAKTTLTPEAQPKT